MSFIRKPVPQVHDTEFPGITPVALRWLDLVRQYSIDIRLVEVTFDPASIAANTTAEQSVTVNGLSTADIIIAVIKPTLTAGIGVLQGRVSATDTLAIQFVNASAGAIDPPSEVYKVIYIKNSRA